MDICLCGILFGIDTNKNCTKISRMPNCAYICCSSLLTWFFFSTEWSLAPLTAPLAVVLSFLMRHQTESEKCLCHVTMRWTQKNAVRRSTSKLAWTNSITELQHFTSCSFVHPEKMNFRIFSKWTFPLLMRRLFLTAPPILMFSFQKQAHFCISIWCNLNLKFESRASLILRKQTSLAENRGTFTTRWCYSHILWVSVQFTSITKN